MFNDAKPSPPINNLLQPDIYNRLDAEAIEKTRVINTQLDERLRVQQKILAKYRLAAERFHRREKDRVKDELTRISTKLPAAHRIKDFRNKFLYGHTLDSEGVPVPEQPPRKIRGVPEEKPQMPFCERFFIHHLPNKKKFYKARTPTPVPFAAVAAEGEGGVVAEGEGGVLPDLLASDGEAAGGGGATATTEAARTDVGKEESSAKPATEANESLGQDQGVPSNSAVDSGLRSVPEAGDWSPSPGNVGRGSGNSLGVGNGKHSPRHNSNGSQSHRNSDRRDPGRTILPPIHGQSMRLSQSTPQLFQG